MPDEWIDIDTGHKVMKLTRPNGLNHSFYFHNNPFVGEEMVFCGGETNFAGNDNLHGSGPKDGLPLYAVNLKTLAIRQLTHERFNVKSEVVCPATKDIFYQHSDTVFALNIETQKRRIVSVMPEALRGMVETVNANGTLLGSGSIGLTMIPTTN